MQYNKPMLHKAQAMARKALATHDHALWAAAMAVAVRAYK